MLMALITLHMKISSMVAIITHLINYSHTHTLIHTQSLTHPITHSGGKNVNSFGWESDADVRSQASTPGPAEESDEEKDERERKEFMEAIRMARGGITGGNESSTETVYDGLDSGFLFPHSLTLK